MSQIAFFISMRQFAAERMQNEHIIIIIIFIIELLRERTTKVAYAIINWAITSDDYLRLAMSNISWTLYDTFLLKRRSGKNYTRQHSRWLT